MRICYSFIDSPGHSAGDLITYEHHVNCESSNTLHLNHGSQTTASKFCTTVSTITFLESVAIMIQQSLADAIIELGNGKGFQITGNTYDDFVVTSAIEETPVVFDRDAVITRAKEIESQIPWNELRATRNQLLVDTDYAALADVTMSDDMRTYRQALRDLPANTSDPSNPTWPTKP